MNLHFCLFPPSQKRPIILVNLFFLYFFFTYLTIEAQDTPVRPRIGLVLSGGGAHGITHLGVIKVMEEAGLKTRLNNRG